MACNYRPCKHRAGPSMACDYRPCKHRAGPSMACDYRPYKHRVGPSMACDYRPYKQIQKIYQCSVSLKLLSRLVFLQFINTLQLPLHCL